MSTRVTELRVEKCGESLGMSFDISKAFDRDNLLSKLLAYGLPVGFCLWIADFLRGRSIRVVVGG